MATPPLSWAQQAELARHLALAVESGVSPAAAIARMQAKVSPAAAQTLATLAAKTEGHRPLSEALAAVPGIFPAGVVQLLGTANTPDATASLLRRLVVEFDRRGELAHGLRRAVLWPVGQLAIALALVGLIIWMSGIFAEASNTRFDLLGLGLVGMRGLLLYGGALLGVLVLGGAIVLVLRGSDLGRAFRAAADRVPVLGAMLRSLPLRQVAGEVRLALETGQTIWPALRMALRSQANSVLGGDLPLVETITPAALPGATLAPTGHYPPDFCETLDLIAQGHAPIDSGGALLDDFLALTERRAQNTVRLAAATGWVLVAGLIAAIIIRVFTQYVAIILSVTG